MQWTGVSSPQATSKDDWETSVPTTQQDAIEVRPLRAMRAYTRVACRVLGDRSGKART